MILITLIAIIQSVRVILLKKEVFRAVKAFKDLCRNEPIQTDNLKNETREK